MSKIDLNNIFDNVIKKIDINDLNYEKYLYELNNINPNDQRNIEYEKVIQNNYKTINELETIKNHYIKKYENGDKPSINIDYRNSNVYLFTNVANTEYNIMPENTLYHIYKYLPSVKTNHIIYVNEVNILKIKYVNFMSLYNSGMIKYLKINIGHIVIIMEEQLNNIPSFITGLYLNAFIVVDKIMDIINKKFLKLTYLDISFSD